MGLVEMGRNWYGEAELQLVRRTIWSVIFRTIVRKTGSNILAGEYIWNHHDISAMKD